MFYPSQINAWSAHDLRALLDHLDAEQAKLTPAELNQWVVFSPFWEGVFEFQPRGAVLVDLPRSTRFATHTLANRMLRMALPETERGPGKAVRIDHAYKYLRDICLRSLEPSAA